MYYVWHCTVIEGIDLKRHFASIHADADKRNFLVRAIITV